MSWSRPASFRSLPATSVPVNQTYQDRALLRILKTGYIISITDSNGIFYKIISLSAQEEAIFPKCTRRSNPFPPYYP